MSDPSAACVAARRALANLDWTEAQQERQADQFAWSADRRATVAHMNARARRYWEAVLRENCPEYQPTEES